MRNGNVHSADGWQDVLDLIIACYAKRDTMRFWRVKAEGGIGLTMSEQEPDRFTASISKARRKGRIFIDWLRNERGATVVAPFSVRARSGARVAIPVDWDELSTIRSAGAFDLKSAVERAAQPQVSSPLVSLGEPAVVKLQKWAGLYNS